MAGSSAIRLGSDELKKQTGLPTDVVVVAGAVGSVSAKLRRLTADMGALIVDVGATDSAVVAAGAIGDVSAKLRRLTTDIGALILQIGANADAAVAAGAAGSVSAKLRRLSTDLDAFKTNFDTEVGMSVYSNSAPGAHAGETIGMTHLNITDGDLYVSTGAAWVLKLEGIWD